MKAYAVSDYAGEPCCCGEQALLLASCCAALAMLVPVVLHQLGAVSHLPDPPGSVFDSDRITESRMAHPLGVPDGLLGVASYGATLALILPARQCSTARTLLGAKLLVDGGAAAFNAVRQVVHFGKLCSWCMGTALATAAMLYVGRDVIVESAATVLAWAED